MAGNAAAPTGPRRTRNNPSPGGLRAPLPPVTRPRKKTSKARGTTLSSQVASQSDSESADNQGHQADSQVEDSEDQQAQQAQSSTSRSARAFARSTRSASRSVSPSHITAPKGKAKKPLPLPLPLPTTFESPTTTSGPSTHLGVSSADTSSRKGKRTRNVGSDLSDADDEAAGEQRPVKRPRGEVQATDSNADPPWDYFDRSNATPQGPGRSFLTTAQHNTPQEVAVGHTETTPQNTSRLSEKKVREDRGLSSNSVRSPINQDVASPERASPSSKKPEVKEQEQHAPIGIGASRLVASSVASPDPKTLNHPLSLNPVEREIEIKQRFGSIRKPRFPPNHNRNRHVRESLNLSDDDDDDVLPPPRRATAEDVIRHRNIRMAKRNLDAVLDNKQPILVPVGEVKPRESRTYRKQSSMLSASRNSMTPPSSILKFSPSALKSSPYSIKSFLSAMRPAPTASIAVVRYLKQTGAPFVLDTPPASEEPLLTAHDWFKANLDFIPSGEEQYAMLENYKKSRIQASVSSSRNTPSRHNAEDPKVLDGDPPRKDHRTVADHHTPSTQSQTQAAAASTPRIPGGFTTHVQQREPVTPVHHLQDTEDDDDSISDISDREVPYTTTPSPILTPKLQTSVQQPGRPAGWVSAVKNIVTSPFKFWAGRSQPAAVSPTDPSRPHFTFDHPSKVPKLPATPARQGDRPSKSKSERRGPHHNRRSPKKSQPQTEKRRTRAETHLPIEQRGRPDFEAIRRQDEFEAQAALEREKKRQAEATKADTDADTEALPHKSHSTFKVPSCSSSDDSDDDRMDIEDDISRSTSKSPSFHQSASVPSFPVVVDEGPFQDQDGNLHDFPLVSRTAKPLINVNLNIQFQKISMKSQNFCIPNIERLAHLKGVPVGLRSAELRLDKIADPERVRQQWSHIEWNEQQAAELFRQMYRRAFMNVPQNSKKLNGELLKGQPWFVKLLDRYAALKFGRPVDFWPVDSGDESLLMRKYALMRLRAIVELDQLDIYAAKKAGIEVFKTYAQNPLSDDAYRLDPTGTTPPVHGGCPDELILETMRKDFYDEIPQKLKRLEQSLNPATKKHPRRREIVPMTVMVQRVQEKLAEQARVKDLIKSSPCEHCVDKDALFDVGPISAPDTPARREYLKSLRGFKDPSFYGDGDDNDEDGAGDFNDVEGGGEDEAEKVLPVVEKPSVESSSRVPQPSVESSSPVVPQPSVESSSPVPQPKAIPTDWTKYHPRKPSQLREVVQMSPLHEFTSNVPRFKAVSDVFKDLLVTDFVPMAEEKLVGGGRMSRVIVQEREQDQVGFRVYDGIEVSL